MRKWICGAAFFLGLAGTFLLLSPYLKEHALGREQSKEIQRFEKEKVREDSLSEETDPLYQEMKDYNERIYAENQAGLTDAFSYEENEFDLSGLSPEGDLIGYLEIEKMDIKIPLYIGANEENLSKGAAVLFQTSMPVGGENTNCVIAGHRGYGGDRLFRDIEELEKGDLINIRNPWGELRYLVTSCAVIQPDELEAVKIVQGEDMITLCTCHPYGSNASRYVVYALREGTQTRTTGEGQEEYREHIESSEKRIRLEERMNAAALCISALVTALLGAAWIRDIIPKAFGKQKEH